MVQTLVKINRQCLGDSPTLHVHVHVCFEAQKNTLSVTHVHVCTYFTLQEAEDFIHTFNEPIRNYNIELALPTSFSDAPYTALRDIKQRDINIIMGFFGPENARNVLCIVSL